MTTTRLRLGEIAVDVVLKDIKNVHLSVYPPSGSVRISAPLRMSLDTIRSFAISKLGWIKNQQKKIRAQERETPREYLDRESHYVWGKRYLLKLIARTEAPRVVLKHKNLFLHVHPLANVEEKHTIIDRWYRKQIRKALPPLISKWESLTGVKVERVFVQRMKTKWGSCNKTAQTIRLNTDLAKKPRECLEYIVVHEIIHILEPTHNSTFLSLMDLFMPQWRHYRNLLNQLPVRHEEWSY
jgi:predicted metal-dependent hydrolase